jgi:hypothetical protein
MSLCHNKSAVPVWIPSFIKSQIWTLKLEKTSQKGIYDPTKEISEKAKK